MIPTAINNAFSSETCKHVIIEPETILVHVSILIVHKPCQIWVGLTYTREKWDNRNGQTHHNYDQNGGNSVSIICPYHIV